MEAKEVFQREEYSQNAFLHVAAADMYLGDGEFIQERFDKAFEYYLTAFEYCDETRDFAATALILSKLGITQYYQHDLKAARYYLLHAIEQYNKTMFFWERGRSYYYLAKISLKQGERNEFRVYLQQAKLYCPSADSSHLWEKIAQLECMGKKYPFEISE